MGLQKQLNTPQEKMAWIWANVDPSLPDIYKLEDFEPNGCGPQGLFGIDLVPDKFIGLPDFEVAGDLHDFRYYIGGTKKDKLKADRELRRNMLKLVAQYSLVERARMRVISELYYLAVRIGGNKCFNYK